MYIHIYTYTHTHMYLYICIKDFQKEGPWAIIDGFSYPAATDSYSIGLSHGEMQTRTSLTCFACVLDKRHLLRAMYDLTPRLQVF